MAHFSVDIDTNLIDKLSNWLGTTYFYLTLDLTRMYQQIPLTPISQGKKIILSTRFDSCTFVTLLFDLFGAPFSWTESAVSLHTLLLIWTTSLFTVSIGSPSAVLSSLRQVGLTVNPKECVVGQMEYCIWGFVLSRRQICPQIDKTAALAASPRPETRQRVRQILRLAVAVGT